MNCKKCSSKMRVTTTMQYDDDTMKRNRKCDKCKISIVTFERRGELALTKSEIQLIQDCRTFPASYHRTIQSLMQLLKEHRDETTTKAH